MTSSYDMLESVKEIFGDKNHVAKQIVMKAPLTTKMGESSFVKEHELKMMNFLNELEILGAAIYGATTYKVEPLPTYESY
ncbi:hypothetical protein KY285_030605 [Solanum tuberosum]|nr:hypothetical protein KY285_030605 [Solanum tuberosum]